MAKPKQQDPEDSGLVFAAHNNHTEHCGAPPRLRSTDNPDLYYGYFENRFGEQFVFTFDPATRAGIVSGGDLGWDDRKSFTPGLLEEVVRDTQQIAAQIVGQGRAEPPGLPVIDAAFALGRVTGLTGKDEVIWLRACLVACAAFEARPGDDH